MRFAWRHLSGRMKRGSRVVFWVILACLALLLAYIRLAPTDVAAVHGTKLDARAVGEYPGTGRFTGQYALTEDAQATLARLNEVALATPRTQVLAGSAEEGKITYITRSRLIGFPDYTTVSVMPGLQSDQQSLQIYARLRFGLDDLGVNKARVQDWAARAGLRQP